MTQNILFQRVEIPTSYSKDFMRYVLYIMSENNGILEDIRYTIWNFSTLVKFSSLQDQENFNKLYEEALNGKICSSDWNKAVKLFECA